MARKKKQFKAKEPIKIRFKELANGNKSIYLDQYVNGKRTYEFLKLYIIPEVDERAKVENANTMQQANAIKSQRIIELTKNGSGISNNHHKANVLLSEWMEHCIEEKESVWQSKSFGKSMRNATFHLNEYFPNATLKQVDVNFCRGFLTYLKNAKRRPRKTPYGETGNNEKPFSGFTIQNYYLSFSTALNMAVRDEIIPFNPFDKMAPYEKPGRPESNREFLTVDEVKKLMDTECNYELLRKAFLFSCFCGLRRSDVIRLTWSNIQIDGDNTFLRIIIKKTKNPLILPLSEMALRWLPEKGDAKENDLIFPLSPRSGHEGYMLKAWAALAGIKKNVTFHVARHTFATMELTAGADLYTTSKLLGHTNVKTTQIYAKIVDKKKTEAVNLVSNLFD